MNATVPIRRSCTATCSRVMPAFAASTSSAPSVGSPSEEFGKMTYEGRFRVWREVWMLDYFGRPTRYQ